MDEFLAWVRLLADVEGGSFAGLCNMMVVCLVVFALRPKQPELSPSVVGLTLLLMAGALAALVICLSTVGTIGLS